MLSVKLPKGRYVVAVSGGVDSMVLLDVLRRLNGVELIVAHLDHGIREDSAEDKKLVHCYAMSHNIKFVSESVKLGSGASEEAARTARYEFLRRCRDRFNAKFIVTAQHQDDIVETVIINLLRGTGWRGLAPFVATADVLRPLADYRKPDIIGYANSHDVPWREDSTNTNQAYLRNYVRQSLLPRLEANRASFRDDLLRLVREQQQLRRTIESALEKTLPPDLKTHKTIDRHLLIMAPSEVSYELLQQMLRLAAGSGLPKPQAEALLIFAKTARAGKAAPLNNDLRLRVTAKQLIVEPRGDMLS